MRYAIGKYAVGMCDRCGLEFPLRLLVPDGYKKGLLVCTTCRDIFPPQEKPVRLDEGIALRNPRPNRDDDSVVIASGTAQAGGADTITLAADATSLPRLLIGQTITLTAGTGVGQDATIADYDGASKVARVSSNWVTPPDETSEYEITPALLADALAFDETFGGAT